MEDMSMVQTLMIWKDGVTFMEEGNFQDALMNFMALEGRTDSSQHLITSGRNLFNIGQTYVALGRMDMAAKAPSCINGHDIKVFDAIIQTFVRNEKALTSYDNAYFYLRGNRLINYQQLGLKAKLYLCEILTNRAIARSRLGDFQEAKNDFLMALQSKVEPRHGVIDDHLLCWQSGQNVEPMKMPSNAVFQPQKRHIDAISEKRDFLGQSKTQPPSPGLLKDVENEQSPEQQIPAAGRVASGRHALLNDLRKKETRRSLKKVSSRIEPPRKPLPGLPDRPESPRRPPPSPRASHTPRFLAESRSPLPHKRPVIQAENRRAQSAFEMKPPSKPLPPAPKSKSPLPTRKISMPAQFKQERDVTVKFQLVLTRSVKVDQSASAQDLLRAAANTFKMSEDSFALWYTKDNQLSSLQEQNVKELLQSPTEQTVFCYENKPE
ncbi:Neutrophil cytosol factor 2 [Stylophora pistillata]|uniref:Neutrophil cytosol factor 2 n=1 Tax=Stylophora pistillata TaxID=50429 RepID=A0A2B4RNM2_STYPI|nr:Neutrophil cytosol factor 2 [Stylophora pistillata]